MRIIKVGDKDDWKLTTVTPVSQWSADISNYANEVVRILGLNTPRMAALAANQIDISYRIIALPGDPIFMPKVVKAEGKVRGTEGCWSIPGIWAVVERPYHVIIKGFDPHTNEPKTWDISDRMARFAMHELDHINGILITDKAISVIKHDDIPVLKS